MQKVTIKAYALKHKLSVFNVMKMIKSRKLQTEILEENGKEVTYLLLDKETELEVEKSIVPIEQGLDSDIQREMKMLTNEVRLLREEIEILKNKL